MRASAPVTVLVAMSESEYVQFVERAIPAYAAQKVESGQWLLEESFELATKSFNDLLPQGRATPNSHFFTIMDAAQVAVGMVWIAEQKRADKRIAYVYDVSIKPQHQRRGHATRAFRALEVEIRAMGLSGIALHVFGHNGSAHALYIKLGYQTTNINMYKSIEATSP